LFENFPRLAKKIDSLWGDSEAIVYINQLLLPERGERHGFSVKVLDELTTLKQIHTFRYPDASLSAHDPFALQQFSFQNLTMKESWKAGEGR
jgi:hypothetical protein